jgi:hypothetical protein
MKVDMGQQESPFHNSNSAITNPNVEVLEQGDIYVLFYRTKKDAQEVKGVEK